MNYDPKKIERKWQERWLKEKIFAAKDFSKKQKYYQLETFPYPSAAGLHVGHPKGYIAEDIHARYMRMQGREVLYTMGWDAFGLPTENYAIKIGKNPKDVAAENVKNFKRQVQMFGLSYDWDREINTSDPAYYKWTQWLFIQLFRKGLAYRKKARVNWCPKDQTVLANEQVVEGKCERCGTTIEQREMEQWFLRIADFADRLLADLRGLDWPASTIKRQEDWIGKSEGSVITFALSQINADGTQINADKKVRENPRLDPRESAFVEVFTTRPDTLFGATYLVLAPEYGQIPNYKSQITNWDEVETYIEAARGKTELMRQEGAKDKTGIELKGVRAINPGTKEEIPIWVADYVLGSYGTGAIMAVPAHDERDFEFATRYNLPIREVVAPRIYADRNADLRGKKAYTEHGLLINSGKFSGMDSETAKWEIMKAVGGEKKTQYKLRDWSVSRQRYWGVPIPLVFCESCYKKTTSHSERSEESHEILRHSPQDDMLGERMNPGWKAVSEKDLPVMLPDLEDYRPKGIPPLASSKEFLKVQCPECKGDAQRAAETLDTFVDSSWYYLAYALGGKSEKVKGERWWNKELLNHWMPVDLYIIGAEHTVLHLLYSRFITKFLHDEGYLNFVEPFLKLRHVGLILGADHQKMSKSKGNVVNPDELVAEFGADAVRLYEMFMGPFEEGQPWDPKGVVGTERFLKKVWGIGSARIKNQEVRSKNNELERLLHQTIKKVGEDIEAMAFNTAVSELMIFVNACEKEESIAPAMWSDFLKLLYPFAPHIAEELWEQMGNKNTLTFEPWPEWEKKIAMAEEVRIVIQINGKVRDTIMIVRGADEVTVKDAALAQPAIKKWIEGKKIERVVMVKDRLINFVIGNW